MDKIAGAKDTIRWRYDGGGPEKGFRPLAEEVALEIEVNGQDLAVLMCTPENLRELVTGYLFTEGLIERAGEVEELVFGPTEGVLGLGGVKASARLAPSRAGARKSPNVAMSSCGLCGKDSLDLVGRGVGRVGSKARFAWEALHLAERELDRFQPLYQATRGVHAALMADSQGKGLAAFEDVGRHNALDKLIGHGLLNGLDFSDKLVALSGRASLEMIIKCARAGIAVFFCFSNPTVLAVETAKAFNITLAGRAENKALAAYTHPRRLVGA